jgi:hypothetical protein
MRTTLCRKPFDDFTGALREQAEALRTHCCSALLNTVSE